MSTEPQTTAGRSTFQRDFLASVVVFLVALPLCMGIAIASGVPVSAGLLSGIIGGLIVATIAGAPLQVSGPAAGLTVIVYGIVQEHGIEYLGIVVLLGGAIQFVAALMGLGQWFRAVSPAVIKGMLAGIGMLIFSSQCHVMVDDAPKGSGLANLASIPEAISKGLPMPAASTHEERRARTSQLKVFGRLHEQRELLFERVVEAEPKGAYGHPEVESTLPPELLERHEELHSELIQRTDELLGAELTVSDERRESIKSAAQHALNASEEAGRQLEIGHWEQAVEAEKEATQPLAALPRALEEIERCLVGRGLLGARVGKEGPLRQRLSAGNQRKARVTRTGKQRANAQQIADDRRRRGRRHRFLRARQVAAGDVPGFMRHHANDLVRRFRLLDRARMHEHVLAAGHEGVDG